MKRLLVSLVLVVAPLAARADEVAWRLEQATCRYDLAVDARPTPAPPLQPAFAPVLLLRQADLRDGRVPTRRAEDLGDLVWHYALLLPAGDVPARGLDATFDDKHAVGVNFEVRAAGTHAVKLRGRRAQVRTQAALSATGASSWLKGGQLLVEKTFSPKGRLELAAWTLDVDVQPPVAQGQPAAPVVKARWAGRITPGEELDPVARDFQGRVQQSIDRGVEWLIKASNTRLNAAKTAGFQSQALGEVALHAFALLRSGVPPAQLDAHFEWMHGQPFREVYSVSLYLMALEARSVERQRMPPQGGMRSVARYVRQPVAAADKERMKQAARWLIGSRKIGEGWWSYGGRPVEAGSRERREGPLPVGPMGHDGTTPATSGDRSNSQFAILALHSAMAAEVEVPGELWEEVLAELVLSQENPGTAADLDGTDYAGGSPLAFDPRDVPLTGATVERPVGLPTQERGSGMARGWGYSNNRGIGANEAYGSMSGAGLSSIAIAREGLLATRKLTAEKDRQALLAMRDGLCWFSKNWDPARNAFRANAWYFYYLYSVEKAMDLCGIERVGPHEWWRDGASELLSRQATAGNWENANETALALLFLNRATLPARLDVADARRVATGADDPSAWDKVVVQGTGQVSVRQVLASLVTAEPSAQRERLELAQHALAAMDVLLRPRVLPELATLAGSSNARAKKWAAEQCEALCGSTEPAQITAFCARYEALRRAWELHDVAQIPMVQAVLTDAQATAQLKRAALLAVGRLRAIEALGEVIAQLDHRDQPLREQAWQTLLSMSGREVHPYDAAAAQPARRKQLDLWRAWWQAEGPPLVQAERASRLVADLADEAKAPDAVKALRAIGQPAVRPLIDALRDPASKARAHALLQELTKQRFPAELDPWLAWWNEQQLQLQQPR